MTQCKSYCFLDFRSDEKKSIRDVVEQVPFHLHQEGFSLHRVLVEDSQEASMLNNSMTTTYDKFEPTQNGIGSKVFDLISGEISKGFHETEEMLIKGTQILGIGKLTLDSGEVLLSPPVDGKAYILTNLTKREIINSYLSSVSVSKFFLWVSIITGSVISIYWLRKLYKKWKQGEVMRQMRQDFERLRQEEVDRRNRLEVNNEARGAGDDNDDTERNMCVVCMANPRTVVAVRCGHLCMCLQCAEQLPRPYKCPYCRQDVERFVPVYIP